MSASRTSPRWRPWEIRRGTNTPQLFRWVDDGGPVDMTGQELRLRITLSDGTVIEKQAGVDPEFILFDQSIEAQRGFFSDEPSLELAARFLYLQRLAFGGKVRGQNFGILPAGPGRFDVNKLGPLLEAVHDRLAGVVIECLPWEHLLRRYDRPETLFYLDPPYWGNETDYGEGLFAPADFERLAEALARLKGPWLLSLNDVPGVRRCFARFEIEAVETSYSIAGGGRQGGQGGGGADLSECHQKHSIPLDSMTSSSSIGPRKGSREWIGWSPQSFTLWNASRRTTHR